MNKEEAAVLSKVVLDAVEHHIEGLPEGDEKAEFAHDIARVHYYMHRIYTRAIAAGHVGDVVALDGTNKPPA